MRVSIHLKVITYCLFTITLLACSSPNYQQGSYFSREIDASGKNPTYLKEGVYENSDFFVTNPYWQKYEKHRGLLVRGDRVIKPLTQDDVNEIRTILAQQARVAQERNKIESDKKIAFQKLEKEKNDKIVIDTNKIINDKIKGDEIQ